MGTLLIGKIRLLLVAGTVVTAVYVLIYDTGSRTADETPPPFSLHVLLSSDNGPIPTDVPDRKKVADIGAMSVDAEHAHAGENPESDIDRLLADLSATDADNKLALLEELSIYAADMNTLPEGILTVLNRLAGDSDPDLAIAAERVGEELRLLQDWRQQQAALAARADSPESVPASSSEPPRFEYLNQPTAWLPYTSLQQQLNEFDNEAVRFAAVKLLAQYRSARIVDMLLPMMTDSSASIRAEALGALWHCAATGLDQNGNIEAQLQYALHDPEQEVARLAKQALLDLQGKQRPAENKLSDEGLDGNTAGLAMNQSR